VHRRLKNGRGLVAAALIDTAGNASEYGYKEREGASLHEIA
jgi:hypothetical protein